MTGDHFSFPLSCIDRSGEYLIFTIDTKSSGFDFKAGKYATLTIDSGNTGGRVSRIFSIASSPLERDKIRFATIYRKESDFKSILLQLVPGDPIEVSAPSGGFLPMSNLSRPLIFVTSGIGVTPVIGIVKWAHSVGREQRMHLIYVNSNAGEELFMDEFLQIGEKSDMFSVSRLIHGDAMKNLPDILSKENLAKYCPDTDLMNAVWYISGKPRFVYGARKTLQDSGFSASSIKTEKFAGY